MTYSEISINLICAHLQIRLPRVLYKVHKLGLIPIEHNVLKIEDALTLLESYVQSKKTSKDTKDTALELLGEIKKGTDLAQFINKPKNKTVPEIINKPFIKTTSIRLIWYESFINESVAFIIVLYLPIKVMVQTIIKDSVQTLEGVYFKFVALIVAISVQMHHSAIWFQRVTPDENTSVYAAYGYAFMVDLFILVVTMEGKLSIAKTFASLTFLSNILYFQFWVNFAYTAQAYTNAISSLLISGIMAYIIYAYTELFVKYQKVKTN